MALSTTRVCGGRATSVTEHTRDIILQQRTSWKSMHAVRTTILRVFAEKVAQYEINQMPYRGRLFARDIKIFIFHVIICWL